MSSLRKIYECGFTRTDGYARWEAGLGRTAYYLNSATQDLRVDKPDGMRSSLTPFTSNDPRGTRMEDVLRYLGYAPAYPSCIAVPEGM